jgi:hypothetical protein
MAVGCKHRTSQVNDKFKTQQSNMNGQNEVGLLFGALQSCVGSSLENDRYPMCSSVVNPDPVDAYLIGLLNPDLDIH